MATVRMPFGQRTLVTTTPDPAPVRPFDLAAHMAAAPFDPFGPPGTIGVVTAELLRYAAFWRSVMSLQRPPGTAFAQMSGLSLAVNRNALAAALVGDWLFCLDDDMVLPPATLVRLLRTMEEGNWDVVAAFSLRRVPPFDSLVYLDDPLAADGNGPWVPDGRTGVVEIAACGLGGVLIHRRVFDALEPPYFRIGQVDGVHLHEDVEFCRRVRAQGFRLCVDLGVPIGHVTPMAVWPARGSDGRPYAALAGVGGETVHVDTALLRDGMTTSPGLIGA